MLEANAIIGLILILGALGGGVIFLRHQRALLVARQRVEELGGEEPEASPVRTSAGPLLSVGAPVLAAVLAAAVASWWTASLWVVSGIAALAAVLVHISQRAVEQSRALALEEGLAEAIGLATASLRAGASPVEALERAARAIGGPARALLLDLVGRLRLGEAPETVFEELIDEVQLESFRLFGVAMATQWRAGGSLDRSLASVARALRDRVELLRRIQTQSAPTRGSVFAFVAATAGIAWLMWQYDPANLESFLRSGTGSTLVGLSVWLQAVGILWMSSLSRIEA